MATTALAPAVTLYEETPAYMRTLLRSGARFVEGNTGEAGDGKQDDKDGKKPAGADGKQDDKTPKPGDKPDDDGKGGDKADKPDAGSDLQKQLDEALAKVKKFEDAQLTDEQKKELQAQENAKKIDELTQENARLKLINTYKIPDEYVSLISGSTDEEREDNAKKVAKLLEAQKSDDQGSGPKTPGVVKRSGTGGDGSTASISSGEDLYYQLNPKKDSK